VYQRTLDILEFGVCGKVDIDNLTVTYYTKKAQFIDAELILY